MYFPLKLLSLFFDTLDLLDKLVNPRVRNSHLTSLLVFRSKQGLLLLSVLVSEDDLEVLHGLSIEPFMGWLLLNPFQSGNFSQFLENLNLFAEQGVQIVLFPSPVFLVFSHKQVSNKRYQ